MKNVAIYCRVSTDHQANDRQIADLQAYAHRANLHIVGTYTETASGAKNDRKVRAEVMQLARERKIDAVLVTELSRWGRSTQDLLSTLNQLAKWNVSLICQTGMDFDLSSSNGQLFLTIMAGFAEFERNLIRDRTVSGLAVARAAGRVGGRPKVSKSIPKHTKAVNQFLADGKSIEWIAHELHIAKDTVMKIKQLAK